MIRTVIFLFTLVLCLAMNTHSSFAQAKPEFVIGQASAQTLTPTPTSKTVQPTTNPSPTAQIPSPTTAVTVTDAPQTKITEAPKKTETQELRPTATPTPLPPTPTPKPKIVAFAAPKKPPEQPIAQIITAPFNLVVNALPYDYYSDQGLSAETTKDLLAIAFFCLLTGTFLLNWPSIVRTVKGMFAPKVKERKSFPYITDRALTK